MIPANELRPHFEGERFKHHTLPLEFSSDLEGLQKIVLEIAKWHYLRDNHKTRMKRGLAADLELHLVGIEAGSAVPILGIYRPQLDLGLQGLFSQTVDTIKELIEGFGKTENWQLPFSFPAEAMRLFEQFGKSLRTNEWINFGTEDYTIRYDHRVRSRILAKVPVARMSRQVLRGTIVELDRDAESFQLKTLDHKVTGRVRAGFSRQLLEIFAHDVPLVIEVEGLCVHTLKDRTVRIEQLDRVDVVKTDRLRDRFRALFELCPEWLTSGPRTRESILRDFFSTWESYVDVRLPSPNLFPIEPDGLEVEWNAGPRHLSIEIAMADLKGTMTFFDDDTAEHQQSPVSLYNEDSWDKLNEGVQSILRRSQQ